MHELPAGLTVTKRTPVFDEATTPAGLLRDHTTKPGVWARIRVLEGELGFRTLGPAPEEHLLTPTRPGIVPPELPHEVALRGPVRFCVEFLREAPEGSEPSSGA